jgi:hypothetical protein
MGQEGVCPRNGNERTLSEPPSEVVKRSPAVARASLGVSGKAREAENRGA